jgi:hypothetical protein
VSLPHSVHTNTVRVFAMLVVASRLRFRI